MYAISTGFESIGLDGIARFVLLQGGASISFSPGDIRDEEREDLEEAIEEKLMLHLSDSMD